MAKAPTTGGQPAPGSGPSARPNPGRPGGGPLKPATPTAKPAKPAQPDESTKAEIAMEAAKTTAKGFGALLMWIVPIVAIIAAAFFIFFQGKERSPQMRTPDGFIAEYSEFVKAYIPPSQLSPTQGEVDTWLTFFDDASRLWFNDNVDKISFLPTQADPERWKKYNVERRRIEAMKYMLTQSPLSGLGRATIKSIDEKTGAAVAEAPVGSTVFRVEMSKSGNAWVFRDFLGQKTALTQRVAGIRLPK